MFGDFYMLSLLNIWKTVIEQDGLVWHVYKATSDVMSLTFIFITKIFLAYSSDFFFTHVTIVIA